MLSGRGLGCVNVLVGLVRYGGKASEGPDVLYN